MNEDDDDADALGATRYPCMPSLVSLQQMRNRLHLAHLGKKLMKWTALATGRELRRITEDLNIAYGNFGNDIRECYILLARSRYFYSNLNKMVIENFPNQASIRVSSFTKTVAGVKVLHYDIIETGREPYQHLAIEKGGQVVKHAKDAWVELLKRMIVIVQLRQGFKQVDEANKNATKRQNVLSKTVIPRVLSSIHYIILELEELAREELYRIKKVVEFKKKKKDKLREKAAKAAKAHKAIFPEDESFVTQLQSSFDKAVMLKSDACVDEVTKPAPDIPEPMKDIKPDISSHSSQNTVNYVKEQLASIISQSKDFMTKISTIDSGSFLKHCEKVKDGMSEAFQSKKPLKLSEEDSEKESLIYDDLLKRLEHLKSHLGSVIDISKEFRDKINISPSVEKFNNLCQTVYDKLDLYFEDIRSTKESNILKSTPSKGQLECPKELTLGSEKFLDACGHKKSRIHSHKYYKNADKLQHLKDHVTDLEQLTTDIEEDGMTSDSFEEFLLACKEFKARIAQYKSEDKTPPLDGKITKLIDQINTAIKLSNAAIKSGLVSNSVQDFIQSCEEAKQRLQQKGQHPEQPKILHELQNNLEDVVNLISELKSRGSINTSVETFLKSCQDTKTKIGNYEKEQTKNDYSDPEFIYPTYHPTVSDCVNEPGICEKCEIWIEEASAASSVILPPCKTCDEPKSSTILPIKTVEIITPEILSGSQSLTFFLSESLSKNSIDSCCTNKPIDNKKSGSAEKKVKIAMDPENLSKNDKNPTATSSKTVEDPPKVNNNLGLFEKKVKKIIKVTRTLNKDGTVKEEKEETITINVTHDPNETKFDDVLEQDSKAGSEQR